MVKINGREMELSGRTLASFLRDIGYAPEKIMVEKDGEIIPRIWYDKIVLRDGDEYYIPDIEMRKDNDGY